MSWRVAVVQRARLTAQSLLKAGGDPEAMELDEDFLRALEYGMPATCRMWYAGATCGNARDAIRCRVMEVNLCVLLWAHEGRDAELSAYEDKVLGLLAEHDGHVIQRARTMPGNGSSDLPTEVQMLRFGSDTALDGYMQDARREALAGQRDEIIAMTEVMRIEMV